MEQVNQTKTYPVSLRISATLLGNLKWEDFSEGPLVVRFRIKLGIRCAEVHCGDYTVATIVYGTDLKDIHAQLVEAVSNIQEACEVEQQKLNTLVANLKAIDL
jgi:hypothetical protein